MGDLRQHVFISHVHEDDDLLPKLRELIAGAGMEVRDGSINGDKPNEAHNEEYIKREILAPRIRWAGVLVVLISYDTHESPWVNWEIECAVKEGKRVVGVYAHGASDADIPDSLRGVGDAVVGWQGERVVAAIRGELSEWDRPDGNVPAPPQWKVERYSCS